MTDGITRRGAIMSGASGLAACSTGVSTPERFTGTRADGDPAFAHGVASGDPAQDSVVLWTRVSGMEGRLPVVVEVARDAGFTEDLRTYETRTSPVRDHTVKLVADGLAPGTRYHYRFRVGGTVSPSGRTRTLPPAASEARFAVVSCSNYQFGHFNAYDHIARDTELDAVIHLGDYIYEGGADGYGGKNAAALGRVHEPAHEILTLADYRQRHAQYKTDPASRAMLAAHPLIPIWDDHETANDAWKMGAEAHEPRTEGEWAARRRAALQAYYEWMPVREPQDSGLAFFRAFTWDGLLTLTAIETRLMARDKQLDYDEVMAELTSPEAIDRYRREVIAAPGREMLGTIQRDFLARTLSGSVARGEPWRVIANQIIMARVVAPNLAPHVTEEQIAALEKEWDQARAFVAFTALGLPYNLDAWDGYPVARQRFYDLARRAGAQDLLVLTGDTHEYWANDLRDDEDRPMGIELGTTSVSSASSATYLGAAAEGYSLLARRENRDVRFHDPMHRGYIRLHLTADSGTADYVAVSTVASPDYDAFVRASFDIRREGSSLAFGRPRGLRFKERMVW